MDKNTVMGSYTFRSPPIVVVVILNTVARAKISPRAINHIEALKPQFSRLHHPLWFPNTAGYEVLDDGWF